MNTCITDIHIRYIIFLFSVFAKRKGLSLPENTLIIVLLFYISAKGQV